MKQNNYLFLVLGLVGLTVWSFAWADAGQEHDDKKRQRADKAVSHWTAPPPVVRRSNPIQSDKVSIQRGQVIYKQYCASCHGSQGRGDGPAAAGLPVAVPDLAAMAPQHPDGELAWKIAEGRGTMPGWKTVLQANQIWDAVNYVKAMARPGDDHSHGDHNHSAGTAHDDKH